LALEKNTLAVFVALAYGCADAPDAFATMTAVRCAPTVGTVPGGSCSAIRTGTQFVNGAKQATAAYGSSRGARLPDATVVITSGVVASDQVQSSTRAVPCTPFGNGESNTPGWQTELCVPAVAD
jgi:hypothetical protein